MVFKLFLIKVIFLMNHVVILCNLFNQNRNEVELNYFLNAVYKIMACALKL